MILVDKINSKETIMEDSMEPSKERLNIEQMLPHKEGFQHLGTVSFTKPTLMIQDSAR